jgi:hypothetical protein
MKTKEEMRMELRNWRPNQTTLDLVNKISEILEGYEMKVTLRQLYYQLVSANVIANKEAEYKRVASIVTDARYAGLIEWEAIEDRTRRPKLPREYADIKELVEAAVYSYELDYWASQQTRPEIWVEKEALANVMEHAVEGLHTAVVVNRGYSSASSMWENAERIWWRIQQRRRRGLGQRQYIRVFYFGDHDPSGLDMVRDVETRIAEFLDGHEDGSRDYFEVVHVALIDEQIDEYNPPPNPTKLSDSRSKGYIDKYGEECWELDALKPTVLNDLVYEAVQSCINDQEGFDAVKQRQEDEIQALRDFAETL